MNKVKVFSEEEFIEGLRNGNDAVMDRLYRLHYPTIEHFIISNNGTEDEARDIYQEAFIIFYESIRDNSLELSCKIKTYLYSVCRRLWLKRLSYKSKYLSKLQDNEEFIVFEDTDEENSKNELRFNIMEESLQKLGEPCRTILEDYYINDLSMQQITDKMGYTNADNAKNQKYKCLSRLKKIVEHLYIKE
jgi:RNA polymerase sigma factor (sigma-70 family)